MCQAWRHQSKDCSGPRDERLGGSRRLLGRDGVLPAVGGPAVVFFSAPLILFFGFVKMGNVLIFSLHVVGSFYSS